MVRPSWSAVSLLAGALVVGVAGVRHPLLQGDGAAQLAVIVATPAWRAIHLALVLGQVLLVAGVTGIALRYAATAGAATARAGALLFAFGAGLAVIQVLFMAGAGTALAEAYARGAAGIATTQAIFLYDMLHPFAQLSGRAGQLAIGLGVAVLGQGLVAGGLAPRGLGFAGLAAGAGCVAWTLAVSETHPRAMAGLGLIVLWALVAGVAALQKR